MWLDHVIVTATIMSLAKGEDTMKGVDSSKSSGSSTSWSPSLEWKPETMHKYESPGSAFGSWPSWFSLNGWNAAPAPAKGAPSPAFSFDTLNSQKDTRESSPEQQTTITPAAQTSDVSEQINTQTTNTPKGAPDTTEMRTTQTTDVPEAPAISPPKTPTVQQESSLKIPVVQSTSTVNTPNTAVLHAVNVSNSGRSKTSMSNSKLCAKLRVEISQVELGIAIDANEDEVNLKVVAIAPLPSGGSRIAFHSGETIIIRELDEKDTLVSTSATVKVPMHDFADMYADESGFVLLGTRDAEGGGTLNCGNPSNLCGVAPNPSVPCYDMYLVRYDGTKETWATKLTTSSAALPPYSTGKTGSDVYMIWWYAHHGRIASDGTNWAAYFGCAISTSESGCINIHQGDRMKVVNPSGAIVTQPDSFDWGCSHSGYERLTYDSRKKGYASICKTDNNNRIMPPNDWSTTIYPVDLAASNLGDIVLDGDVSSKKYWATVSNGNEENAKVHVIHFAMNAATDNDIVLGGTDANERAPHLATIGKGGLLAMWEGSSAGGDLTEGGARTVYAQVLDATTGQEISSKVTIDKAVVGNRYQALKSFPDGSVAYLSKGTTATSVQVVRFFAC